MFESLTIVVALAGVFAAATIQGITGFGFMLVSIPLLTIFVDPHLVVPAMVVQAFATSLPVILHARRHLHIRRMWPMTLAGMIGVPVGTLILVVLDPSLLRTFIGFVVVLAAIGLMSGFRKPFGHERAASIPIGFASGILGASTGLAGPPVVLFYTNQSLAPAEFRANIVAYFILLDVVLLPSFFAAGLFTREAVLFSTYLLPASIIGALAGILLNHRVNERVFRLIALILILSSGIVAAATGLFGS